MDIELRCECGKQLDNDIMTDRWHTIFLEVGRCQDCIDEAVKEAVESAKKESYDEGYEAGKEE